MVCVPADDRSGIRRRIHCPAMERPGLGELSLPVESKPKQAQHVGVGWMEFECFAQLLFGGWEIAALEGAGGSLQRRRRVRPLTKQGANQGKHPEYSRQTHGKVPCRLYLISSEPNPMTRRRLHPLSALALQAPVRESGATA
jgi:hypothetical protein